MIEYKSVEAWQEYVEYTSCHSNMVHREPSYHRCVKLTIVNDGWDYRPDDIFPIAIENRRYDMVITTVEPCGHYQDVVADELVITGYMAS